VWSWDFVFDRTESGQTLKWFVIVDEFTRRCITLDVSRGFKSTDIIDRLSELFVMYGMPEHIRSDNGPEFIAKGIRQWLGKLGVQTLYIEPGSPWENGITESFNSRLRDELLKVEQFSNAAHARASAAAWREDYNEYRPHSSLNGLPPAEFARRCAASAPAAPTGPSPAEAAVARLRSARAERDRVFDVQLKSAVGSGALGAAVGAGLGGPPGALIGVPLGFAGGMLSSRDGYRVSGELSAAKRSIIEGLRDGTFTKEQVKAALGGEDVDAAMTY
jgi:hypothetical protein